MALTTEAPGKWGLCTPPQAPGSMDRPLLPGTGRPATRMLVPAMEAELFGCVPPFTHGVLTRRMRLMKPGVIRTVPDVRFHVSFEAPLALSSGPPIEGQI